jgi:hypothetical protein
MQVEVGLRDAIRNGRISVSTLFSFYAARFTRARNLRSGRMGGLGRRMGRRVEIEPSPRRLWPYESLDAFL